MICTGFTAIVSSVKVRFDNFLQDLFHLSMTIRRRAWGGHGEEGEVPSKVSGAEPAAEVVDEARPLTALETFPGLEYW